MAAGAIRLERSGHLALVTIDRPDRLNACTQDMYVDIGNTFVTLAADDTVRCVLLRAEGERAFCVGSDIEEFRDSLGDPDRQAAETRTGRWAMDALYACPHPIVAAINGACVGGGLQIAAGCDVRLAGHGAQFGIPIRKLGVHAEIEDLERMMTTLGHALCLDLLLTGRMLGAREAHDRGFVSRIVAPDSVEETARSTALEIAEGAPLAARWHKRALRLLATAPEEARSLADLAFAYHSHQDYREGCQAFLEQRRPIFTGA